MAHNIKWLETNLVLLSVLPPIQPQKLTETVGKLVAGKATCGESQFAILVDGSQIDLSRNTKASQDIPDVLSSLQAFGPVVIFGLSWPVERLLKLAYSGNVLTEHPLYFAKDQQTAVTLIHRVRSITSSMSLLDFVPESTFVDKSPGNKPSFINHQTERLFHAFVADEARLNDWRTMVDAIYEDGEIAFETVMFVKKHQLADADDLAINWDQLIIALLNETDG